MAARVAIVGGGYAGTAMALALARSSSRPLDIRIVDPAPEPGRGLAYSTPDPDHRLNAQDAIHITRIDDIDHFPRWLRQSGALAADPEAIAGEGQVFARRSEFGRYMAGELADAMVANPSGSTLQVIADRAVDVADRGREIALKLSGGGSLAADLLVVATGNSPPSLPGPLAGLRDHPGVIADPWDLNRVEDLPRAAPVLILGTALTTADIIVTLLRNGHEGPITALSRRGLVPQRQGPFGDMSAFLERLKRPVPDFVERHGLLTSPAAILAAVRADAGSMVAEGRHWRFAFDHLRDAAGVLWRGLDAAARRSVLAHAKAAYDTHRYRMAPQVMDRLDAARASGQLTFVAGRVLAARAKGSMIVVDWQPRGTRDTAHASFDGVINCTGPEARPERSGNPFLARLVATDLARSDPFGLGFDVDGACRALGAGGRDGRIVVLGALTRGWFGDVIAVPQITVQISRILPGILARLESATARAFSSQTEPVWRFGKRSNY